MSTMAAVSETTLVLVTGASGYIASHIVRQLQEEGYRVRGTIRSLGDEEKVKKLNELCPEAEHKLELVEADLNKPDSWEPAMKDVTYVIHVASPFPSTAPKDESEVVTPAVEGTQAVLKACVTAKSVKRVVMTSSCVAVGWGAGVDLSKTFNEDDWTDPEKLDAYGKSKTLAEKAAWDYVKELPDEDKIELAVVNPSYVMGPVINGSQSNSLEVVKRLLEREMHLVPKLNFNIVDVRDVANAHIKAMTLGEAAGKRHLVTNANIWMKEIGQILSKEFKSQGYNVPTTGCPNAILWMNSCFNKNLKTLLPQLNKVYKFDNTRMKEVLAITPKEPKEIVIDMAYSLIENGLVKKAKKYRGPNAGGEEAAEETKEEGGEKTEEKEGEEKPKENGDVKEEKPEEDDLKKESEEKEEEKPEKIEDVEKEEEKPEEKPEEETKTEEKTEEKSEEKTEESTPAE
ncbi:putative uncharacterized oxidoreductase YDR541C [Pecten maximus]|uniref:putative uncharacterized oxidoreductase YDR541C n=1 Tax=Pecten maximus TaxID=6579 RepID=UPI0014589BA0|nr:putative uncharacterized oxidoreductase YDR541C [Pecten maximus]